MFSKSLLIYITTFFLALAATHPVQGQKGSNTVIVENIYAVLQKNSTTSEEIKALIPKINRDELSTNKEVNERYTITFPAIMKNEWRGILFHKLEFQQTEKNTILVTGTVSGRQPTECEGVQTSFQHLWTLKDGEIINFKEY